MCPDLQPNIGGNVWHHVGHGFDVRRQGYQGQDGRSLDRIAGSAGGAKREFGTKPRGQLGGKTIMDAIEAARRATEELDNPGAMIEVAVRAAAALGQFRDQPFRQGRARIFGSKGIGRDDPGMVAFQRILETLTE